MHRLRLPGWNVQLRVLPDEHVREVDDGREGIAQVEQRVADVLADGGIERGAGVEAHGGVVGGVEVEAALVDPVAQPAVHRHADVGSGDVQRGGAVVLQGEVEEQRVAVGGQRVLAVDGGVQRRGGGGEEAGHEGRLGVVAGGADRRGLPVGAVVDDGDGGAVGGAEVEAQPELAKAALAGGARLALPIGGGDGAAVRIVAVRRARVLDDEAHPSVGDLEVALAAAGRGSGDQLARIVDLPGGGEARRGQRVSAVGQASVRQRLGRAGVAGEAEPGGQQETAHCRRWYQRDRGPPQ